MIFHFTIYRITNKVNGKLYVGQTLGSVKNRWKAHVSASKFMSGCRVLGAAIRKYGNDAFSHEILEVIAGSQSKADNAEIRWIKKLGCRSPLGYNLTSGGGALGRLHDSTKQLIGIASKKRLAEMTPDQRAAYFLTNIHLWTPERRLKARKLSKSKGLREKVRAGQKKFWADLSSEEKTRRVKHQLSGMSAEQKSDRVRKSWAKLTPEEREIRVRKTASASAAAKANPAHSKKMSEWQTAQAKLRTPEQRQAMVLKAWETRRAKYGDRGHTKSSAVFSEGSRKGWANMTPEARTERGNKIKEGRRKAKEARLRVEGEVAQNG